MQQREEKKKIIKDLRNVFQTSASVLVIEYRGLDVKSMQFVRRQVKESDSELRVVKNKLLHKACEGTDVEQIKDLFRGPTAIAICGQEIPATAKVFVQARKEFEDLILKGGLVEGRVCGAAEIEQLSKLPSRNVLISMFASALVSPLSNFVGVINQMRCKLIYALEALKETKGGQGVYREGHPETSVSDEAGTQSVQTGEANEETVRSPSVAVADTGEAKKTNKEKSSKNQNKQEENGSG